MTERIIYYKESEWISYPATASKNVVWSPASVKNNKFQWYPSVGQQ